MEIVMNAVHLQTHKVPMIPRLAWDDIDMRIGHDDTRAKGIFWMDSQDLCSSKYNQKSDNANVLLFDLQNGAAAWRTPPSKRIGVFTNFRCALLTRSFLPRSLSATVR